MKHWFTLFTVWMVIASLLLTACGTQSTREITVLIGFTASQSGSLRIESTRQSAGIYLWMKQANESASVTLEDGTVVKFEAKVYDDESNKDRVTELYTQLVTQDNVTFMISPYSSGLAEAAAEVAEQNGRVMITAGAASDATYQKGRTLIFQTYTPGSKYLNGALDLLEATDPSAKRIAIVHEEDSFSTGVANALNKYARGKGYEVVMYESYASDTSNFITFIEEIQELAPDAVMGGGHFKDGSQFAEQLYERGVSVKFVSLLVAPPDPVFGDLGEAAFGLNGPSQWEPQAAFSEADASAGVEWYGPSQAQFLEAYGAAYSEEPSYHAAGGYAAGLLLQKAIEKAGSLETEAVKAALESLDLLTFFGRLKFDTSAEAHGLQTGHLMVYIQWQKDAADILSKQIIWPEGGATGELVYPIR